ncbi:CRTAC1 family protein [Halosimplex salinum]|uniref:CRTAC1 family protein n=1 Tax=Halosimplex salinum TaxID=1710538 RepID=UPI000F49114D|nr:CRTAC1 family protein [Halosimplex salinum]
MTGTPTGRRAAMTVAVAALLVVSGCTGAFGGTSESDDSAELGFENVTREAGLDYEGTGTGAGNGNSGVYTADVDNDGWEDLLAIGGERPVLYRNTGGEFDRSGALPSLERPFKSATFVDYDGDGWRDLLLFAHDGEAVALHNDEGTFERDDVGLDDLTYPLGATVADYDGDGDRDLFVYQSGDWADERPDGYFSTNRSIADDNGNPNVLYENTGDGFERADAPGIEGDRWSLAASFVDLTGDGTPDVHVANDYNNDTVYLNRGDGTFEQRQLGGPTARNGMASEIGDVNGDGRPDVFVTNIDIPVSRENMSAERFDRLKRFLDFVIHSGRTKGNTMLVNEGDGRFDDQAPAYGVRQGGWGWAASFADFDNDGDRDLLHTTQIVVRLDMDNPVYTLPMIWEREGDDFDRLNASARGFEEHDGRGMVTMDYDRDGDQDVVIASYHGDFAVYENTAEAADAVQFEVVDGNGATALGATATVEADGTETSVWQNARTGFLSQESPVTHVGTGDAETVTLSVTWPDGEEASFEVDANARYRVTPDGVETVANLTSGD